MPLAIGSAAPDFDLMTHDPARKVRLSDFRGKRRVVLLFYPMDFSSVCTAEICGFGPQLDVVAGDDTVVFGVSCDSPFTHAAFIKQYGIGFELLSDVTRDVVKAYDLYWPLPFNVGKRATVVVGLDGTIEHFDEVGLGTERTIDALKTAVGH